MQALQKHKALIDMLAADKPNKVIADELDISEDYLYQKLHRLRKAARVRTNTGLVAKAMRRGVIQCNPAYNP